MKEEWKDINGYEGLYQVSNMGNVRAVFYKTVPYREKAIFKNQKGYCRVNLVRNKKTKAMAVHRLVAIHFIKKPDHLNEVNHKNGNKDDNRHTNLEWSNRSMNVSHMWGTGLRKKVIGEKNHKSKLKEKEVIEIIEGYSDGFSASDIAKYYKVSRSTIFNILSGRSWSDTTGIRGPLHTMWK